MLSQAMDSVLSNLKGMSKAIYQGGRFVAVADGTAVFALGNAPTRDQAEKRRTEVEAALAQHFGHPVPLRLVDEAQAAKLGGAAAPSAPAPKTASAGNGVPVAEAPEEEHESVDVRDLADATDVPSTAADKLAEAFPGATVVED
jgi:hypothetical protein